MAGAGDVPLAGPRVLAVRAALQQQLPGALAVDPHVHRPVVVAVPVHLRPAMKKKNRANRGGGVTRSDRIESNRSGGGSKLGRG